MVAAPRPILVLQAIRVGLSCLTAHFMAARIACMSWPSTALTAQPAALKRAFWSVASDRETAPSMVMALSSHSTVSLFSL